MSFMKEQINHILNTTSEILLETLPTTYKIVTYSIVNYIDDNDSVRVVLSGLQCSGKTISLKQILQYYNSRGSKVIYLNGDTHYEDLDTLLEEIDDLGYSMLLIDNVDNLLAEDELRICLKDTFKNISKIILAGSLHQLLEVYCSELPDTEYSVKLFKTSNCIYYESIMFNLVSKDGFI